MSARDVSPAARIEVERREACRGASWNTMPKFERVRMSFARPSAGRVRYRGAPLGGPAEGIAVVFQTFALYPWLTVLANVELGLDASGSNPVWCASAQRRPSR